jgi:hypothetical protein
MVMTTTTTTTKAAAPVEVKKMDEKKESRVLESLKELDASPDVQVVVKP